MKEAASVIRLIINKSIFQEIKYMQLDLSFLIEDFFFFLATSVIVQTDKEGRFNITSDTSSYQGWF